MKENGQVKIAGPGFEITFAKGVPVPSKTGKMMVVLSTRGLMTLQGDDGKQYTIGLNVMESKR